MPDTASFKTITVKPLAPYLGAEIEGIDLSQPLSNAQFDDIHQAFLKHHVIFFRDQKLTPEQHLAFGRRWGTLNIHPYVKSMPGYPEILEIIKEPTEKINFGGGWHSDMSFLEVPALGSILHAIEVPEVGGDTLFASQYAAWDARFIRTEGDAGGTARDSFGCGRIWRGWRLVEEARLDGF